MDMIYFFLPAIIFLGVVTSYEDIKGRGIRNKWVLFAIIYSFVVLSGLVLYLFFSGQGIIFSYISDYFINIIISLVFGFIIWKAGFWSAGDGKLFFAFSALLPLSVYSFGYIRFFPSFTLFINTIVLVFIFLVGNLLLKTSLNEKMRILKESFNKKVLLMVILSLFGLSWLIRIMLYFSGIGYDMFTFLILVPVIYVLITSVARKSMDLLFGMLVILRFIFDYTYIFSLSFAYTFAFIIVFYVCIKYFIFGLSYEFFSRNVRISDIKEGMILADVFYKEGKKYVAKSNAFNDFQMRQKGKVRPVFNTKGLTKDDVKRIKELHKEGKIDSILKVQKTMPFAIFMFLGVILTLIFQGNVILIVKFLLGV